MESFADFIQRERERFDGERAQIFNQQQELEAKLADLNREISAIDAYEAVMSGKPARATSTRRPSTSRRGSKREQLLEVIRAGGGLARGEILEKMSLKGNKSGEMYVSNALTALTKANQVSRRDGKYHAA